jgi:hypothetical protein
MTGSGVEAEAILTAVCDPLVANPGSERASPAPQIPSIVQAGIAASRWVGSVISEMAVIVQKSAAERKMQ